jgi:MtN3 and saliva related transmembrane protein
MTWTEAMGHLGAFLSSVTFIPQVYKAWQSRSVGDLSFTMILIVFTSTVVWLIYAFSLSLWPVIICNSIVCVLSIVLVYFKLTFKK